MEWSLLKHFPISIFVSVSILMWAIESLDICLLEVLNKDAVSWIEAVELKRAADGIRAVNQALSSWPCLV